MKELNFNNMFNSKKLMDRFFRKVDNVVWDLSSGKIGVVSAEGITTIEGEGEDAQIVVNMFDQFGMPIPAFAQNTPVDAVQLGDLIFGKTISGWVVAINEKSFELLKSDGTRTKWSPPKVQMMGIAGVDGVMVLRSLINMLPGGSTGLGGMQSMMLPMMMMGGDMDLDSIMPMMLMSQMGTGAVDADGVAAPGMDMTQMMPMMMMMSMMKGGNSNNSPFGQNFFDRTES